MIPFIFRGLVAPVYLIFVKKFGDQCKFTMCSFQLQSRQHRAGEGRRGGMPPSPRFCVAKRKKGNQGKKERFSKQKLLKDCHQGQNVTVLAILECLEFKKFSCRPAMVAGNTFQCSMALAL